MLDRMGGHRGCAGYGMLMLSGSLCTYLVHRCAAHVSMACSLDVYLLFACQSRMAMQGAPKNEEWAGWESAAAREDKAGRTTDEWGKW